MSTNGEIRTPERSPREYPLGGSVLKTPAEASTHTVEVFLRDGWWCWTCSCERHLGFGRVRAQVEAAAKGHVCSAGS